MIEKPIRYAVIGTGHMARTFAGMARAVDGFELAGCFSKNEERAANFATQYKTAAYTDLERLLADQSVDMVYVASESASHADIAIAALEARKAVLCEKPCGISATQVKGIIAAARRTGSLFMEAMPTPFLPAVSAALDAVQKGSLGEPRRLTADFGSPASRESHPGCYSSEGGGVLLDRAIYPVALALMALGPAIDVQSGLRFDDSGIDVDAWIVLTHVGGAVSSLAASFTCELENRLSISGTQGAAYVDAPLLAAERLRLTRQSNPPRRKSPSPGLVGSLKRQPALRRILTFTRDARKPFVSYGDSIYRAETEHFRDLIRRDMRASPILTPELTVATAEILEQVRRAQAA